MDIPSLMRLLGFEFASDSKLNQQLPRVQCNGNTAFRDAVYKGNQLMQELYSLCCQFDVQDHYKFVHVVLTDGEDNSSTISLKEFLVYQLQLQLLLKKNILQTFYIGVNVENNQNVKKEMQAILQSSGNSAEYHSISSNGINDIFQKIQMKIGVRVQERNLVIGNQQATISLRQQQISPIFQLQINNYIVLFTLDISQSMETHWNKVCQAVKGFLANLGSNDLVLGIIFNEQVQVLSGNQNEKYIENENQSQDEQLQDPDQDYDQEQDQEQDQDYEQDQEQSQIQKSQQQPKQQIQYYQQQEPQQQNQQQQFPIDKPQNQLCSCQVNCQIS